MVTLSKNGKIMGRPPGSKNKAHMRLKELARKYTDAGVEEMARIAGLISVPARDPDGNIIMEPMFNDDGSPRLDPDGRQLMQAKMRRLPGSAADTARVAAIQALWDRGFGKATQLVGGDDEAAPIAVKGIELEVVPVGTPLNDDVPPPDEEEDDEANVA